MNRVISFELTSDELLATMKEKGFSSNLFQGFLAEDKAEDLDRLMAVIIHACVINHHEPRHLETFLFSSVPIFDDTRPIDMITTDEGLQKILGLLYALETGAYL